jgi:hypothetical protein
MNERKQAIKLDDAAAAVAVVAKLWSLFYLGAGGYPLPINATTHRHMHGFAAHLRKQKDFCVEKMQKFELQKADFAAVDEGSEGDASA